MTNLKLALSGILLCASLSGLQAQANWTWGKGAVNVGSDIGIGVATDSLGNVYTAGHFSPFTIVFDTVTISNPSGNTVFFLTKHDPAGNVLWGRTVTGSANCMPSSIAADSAGNVFITGYFNGNLPIGSTTLVNTDQFGGTPDIFIAKYDSDGNFLWARNPAGAASENAHFCSVDRSGNCYVTGYFRSPTLTFGSIPVNNSDVAGNSPDIFLVKYDPNGNALWAKSEGEVSDEISNSCSADVFGNIVIAGWFTGPYVVFGNDTMNNNGTYGDLFVVKYDANGNQLWTIHEGGSASELAYSVSTGPHGEVMISGQFQSLSMVFGTTTITNADGIGNYSDIFTARYDADGNFQWVRTAGGNRSDHANSISVDEFSNAFVTGGYSSANAMFGSSSLTNADNTANTYDIFLAKYDSTGALVWVRRSGGNNDDIGFCTTTDRYNACTITGYFKSPTILFNNDTLVNSSGSFVTHDAFIAHLEDPTAINENQEQEHFISVYPNPSGDNIWIQSDLQQGEIIITTISGAEVCTQKLTGSNCRVGTGDLAEGTYVLTVISESGSYSTRFVKLK